MSSYKQTHVNLLQRGVSGLLGKGMPNTRMYILGNPFTTKCAMTRMLTLSANSLCNAIRMTKRSYPPHNYGENLCMYFRLQ